MKRFILAALLLLAGSSKAVSYNSIGIPDWTYVGTFTVLSETVTTLSLTFCAGVVAGSDQDIYYSLGISQTAQTGLWQAGTMSAPSVEKGFSCIGGALPFVEELGGTNPKLYLWGSGTAVTYIVRVGKRKR